jgi:DNA-binding MarR family transcriptional regulator
MRLINEILQMVAGGSSVREIADKFGLTTDSVLARLLTMERMGLLSIEDRTVPGCGPSKCKTCCGCAPSQATPRQYRLTEKGKKLVKRSSNG